MEENEGNNWADKSTKRITEIREDLESVRWEAIERDLAKVLNRYNVDAALGKADFVLAEFLVGVLKSMEEMYTKPSATPPNIVKKGGQNFGEASK